MPSRNQVGPGNGHNQGQDGASPSRGGGGPNGGAGGYSAGDMISFKPSAGQDGVELQAPAKPPPNNSDVSILPGVLPTDPSPKPLFSTIGQPRFFPGHQPDVHPLDPHEPLAATRTPPVGYSFSLGNWHLNPGCLLLLLSLFNMLTANHESAASHQYHGGRSSGRGIHVTAARVPEEEEQSP
jgi:hypothetical protein